MKKWIAMLFSMMILVVVPAMTKTTCLAAPAEVGVTTLRPGLIRRGQKSA